MVKNLELLFTYYKEGKISEFTLCSELEDYLQTNLRTKVIIETETSGSSASSFVAAILPIKTDIGYKVQYIIDKKAINSNLIETKEIIEILDFLKNAEQKVIASFRKELQMIPDNSMTVRDALIIYTKMYRMCLDAYPYPVRQKLHNNHLLDVDAIDANIDKLMDYNEKTEHIIETLLIKDIVPLLFVEEAKKLAKHDVARKIVLGTESEPDLNVLETKFGRTLDSDKALIDTAQVDMDKVLSKVNN